jgi:hypothetical protein
LADFRNAPKNGRKGQGIGICRDAPEGDIAPPSRALATGVVFAAF